MNKVSTASGMARAEWAIIMGIVVIVLSFVLSGMASLRENQRERAVLRDLDVLVEASERFFDEYRIWPTSHTGEYGDRRYGEHASNREVMHALRAMDDKGNEGHGVNPSRIAFIDVPPAGKGHSGLDEQGAYVDPWGNEYQIAVDTDFDNNCNVDDSIYGRVSGEGFVVWSYGPDGKGDTADDILSWKM